MKFSDYPVEANFFKKNKSKTKIIALDEVGRGPLAGPVVSCAVYFCGTRVDLQKILKSFSDINITDSKKLTNKKRLSIIEKLGVNIFDFRKNSFWDKKNSTNFNEISFSISQVGPEKIDEINILQASLLSMYQCFNVFKQSSAHVWIDGNQTPPQLRDNAKIETIVKGDSKSLLIALASILAKEIRDQLMIDLSKTYPGYGFEKHAGYPTKFHKEAIRSLGATPSHRKSFKGVFL